MGTRMIKQEDGSFGLFSTYNDQVIALDCDEDEMLRIWKGRAAQRAEEEMKQWLEVAKSGKPHPDSPMTLDDALKRHMFHGEDDDWHQAIREMMAERGITPWEDRDKSWEEDDK